MPASSSGNVSAKLRAVDLDLLQAALLVVGVFIRQAHNDQSLVFIFLVELLQHRRFVVAVRAPGAEDIDDERLTCELGTALVHRLARLIYPAEAKRLLRIFDSCQGLGQGVRIGCGFVLAPYGGERFKRHNAALLALQATVRQKLTVDRKDMDTVETAQMK